MFRFIQTRGFIRRVFRHADFFAFLCSIERTQNKKTAPLQNT